MRYCECKIHFSGRIGVIVPGAGSHQENRVIPDGTFTLAGRAVFSTEESWLRADGIDMVLEVTEARPELARVAKRRGYARAGIPLYLLVDREERAVTLFSGPDLGDYEFARRVPYGKPIPLPFGLGLDTSRFV